MTIDKSDRVYVMLVFEGLPVQFYELVGTITWSMNRCSVNDFVHKSEGQIKGARESKPATHFLYLDLFRMICKNPSEPELRRSVR